MQNALSSLISHLSYLLCKSQGARPCFLRLFVVFGCFRHIFAFGRQKSDLCNCLQSFLCKTVSVLLLDQKIGYCYWRRTDFIEARREWVIQLVGVGLLCYDIYVPAFCCSIQKQHSQTHRGSFFRAGMRHTTCCRNQSFCSISKTDQRPIVQFILLWAEVSENLCSEARPPGPTAAVSSL